MTDKSTDNSRSDGPTGADNASGKERIAKVLARAGVGSRRDIERMIAAGRVRLDGAVVTTPATFIDSVDSIRVDGKPVTSGGEARLWRLHKRRGTLTTHRDPGGRPTVFDKLPGHLGRVISVGRLDMNTEGLLLLTNDGALARYLELPETGLARRYRVRVHGRVDEAGLAALKDGVTIDGIHYGPVDAAIEKRGGTNSWLTVTIYEGKNREVRRLMEYLGLSVNRLVRTHYGPFALGRLPQDAVEPMSHVDLRRALPGFFAERAGDGTAEQASATNPAKWAKAKKQKTVKPGYRARRKASDGTGDETGEQAGAKRAGDQRMRAASEKGGGQSQRNQPGGRSVRSGQQRRDGSGGRGPRKGGR